LYLFKYLLNKTKPHFSWGFFVIKNTKSKCFHLSERKNHETIKQDRLGNNARDVADDDDDSEAEQQKP